MGRLVVAILAGLAVTLVVAIPIWLAANAALQEIVDWAMPRGSVDEAIREFTRFDMIFAIASLPGLMVAAMLARRGSSDDETRCRSCGYILRGLTEPRCPECGQAI